MLYYFSWVSEKSKGHFTIFRYCAPVADLPTAKTVAFRVRFRFFPIKCGTDGVAGDGDYSPGSRMAGIAPAGAPATGGRGVAMGTGCYGKNRSRERH